MNGDRTSYERALAPVRAQLAASRFATRLLAPASPPSSLSELLERFVIEVTARGVAMAEPAEECIESAAHRCSAHGFPEIGKALARVAQHEAGRHLRLIADTHALVARRRRQGRPTHPAGLLLGRPSTPAIRRAIRLHEDAIGGPWPCAELAVLFEIQNIWATHGPALVSRCRDVLGPDCVSCMTFIEEHARPDSMSARLFATELDRLLTSRPDATPALISAGSSVIHAYGAFFDECLDGALILGGRGSGSQSATRDPGSTPHEPPDSPRSRSRGRPAA